MGFDEKLNSQYGTTTKNNILNCFSHASLHYLSFHVFAGGANVKHSLMAVNIQNNCTPEKMKAVFVRPIFFRLSQRVPALDDYNFIVDSGISSRIKSPKKIEMGLVAVSRRRVKS